MAPFPTLRRGPNPSSPSLLPTSMSYPPSPALSPSASWPSVNLVGSSNASSPLKGASSPLSRKSHGASNIPRRLQSTDPKYLFGGMSQPADGVLGGLGQTSESRRVVRECLEHNHLNHHIFINDQGFHNHASHRLLAAYSLGAGPKLIKDIYELEKLHQRPMMQLQLEQITEANWTQFLGKEKYYPNYLHFFHEQIAQKPAPSSPYHSHRSSVVPVVEKYLLTSEGDMLVRAVSGAIHPLIHVGYGIEFQLDEVVAEGLAQAAVHKAQVGGLFPSPWPPSANSKGSSLQNSLTNAFSSFRLSQANSIFGSQPVASGESFAKTAASLPRDDPRYPREGLSAMTILDRIASDPELAPGMAVLQDDFPRLNKAIEKRGERIRDWCDEWKFSRDASGRWDNEEDRRRNRSGVVSWDEIVEKCEELQWVATLIYAATSRPQYVERKLDFFLMHCLTSSMFLPSILEVISPHLRPYLLHSHFRVMVGYWISRGRPELHVEHLMQQSATPSSQRFRDAKGKSSSSSSEPFAAGESAILRELQKKKSEGQQEAGSSADDGSQTPAVDSDGKVRTNGRSSPSQSSGDKDLNDVPISWLHGANVNPWGPVIASAPDHSDDHVPKVVRALAYASLLYGKTPAGMYRCSLPGTDVLDGSVFIRAAGITMDTMGWMHEGLEGHDWDRSVIGFDEAWKDCTPDPNYKAPQRHAQPSWSGQQANASGRNLSTGASLSIVTSADTKGKGREDDMVDSFTNEPSSAQSGALQAPFQESRVDMGGPRRDAANRGPRDQVGLGVQVETEDSEEERELMG